MHLRPLQRDVLSLPSRVFCERLLRLHPEVAPHVQMRSASEHGPFDVLLELPSPTGEPDRLVSVWMENGEPSLGMGTWHTHAALWEDTGPGKLQGWMALIELLGAIMEDRFVLCLDLGGETPDFEDVLDLRDREALAERLTCRGAPPDVRIKSWGGTADGVYGLEDLAT